MSIHLTGPWTVSRRGPRPWQELTTYDAAYLGQELYVLSRDGVLCLQRAADSYRAEPAVLIAQREMITGEHVEPLDDPHHEHGYTDIVRVTR